MVTLHPSSLEIDGPLHAEASELRLLSVAHALTAWAARWPGIDDPVERCWHTITRTADLEAMVIAWPVGGSIELHDHGPSSGAVVVVAGTLTESSLVRGSGALITRTVDEHHGIAFGPRYVHDVTNAGPRPAISVHVYSPALTSMTYYDLAGRALVESRTEWYEFGEARP